MTAKTTEELRSILVDAVEGLDDAEQRGETLSRYAIATLVKKITEAADAAR